MVDNQSTYKVKSNLETTDINIPTDDLSWSSVKVSELLDNEYRVEASVYNLEGKHAREQLNKSKWDLVPLTGEKGLAEAYHRPRFKRIWVAESEYPIYQPSLINEINPQPSGYLSPRTPTDIESLRVKYGQILLTCSGTIGNCSMVSDTLDNKIFSHDLIRINTYNEADSGFVYAFLKTKIGNTLVNTNNYGAVISHIEPEHLKNIEIPNPSNIIKFRISKMINESFKLRDESNKIIEESKQKITEELNLYQIGEEKTNDSQQALLSWSTKLSELNNRLDGSFHKPIVSEILNIFNDYASNVKELGELVRDIILPGRFSRVYVEEGQGTKFLGGKDIFQLSPTTEKYISNKLHRDKIEKELKIRENSILTPSRGSLGRLILSPKHFEGWTVSDNVIQIVPDSNEIIGYIYAFLDTVFAKELIQRYTYGGVVDALEVEHIGSVPIPFLKNRQLQDNINNKVLEANKMRYEAYKLEQKAIKIMEEEVIFAE